MTARRAAAPIAFLIALSVLGLTGCGPKTPDYQSVWSTPTSAPPPPATSTEAPVPVAQFFEEAGVIGRPMAPEKLTDLTVTMPTPPGWQPYFNANFEPGTRVIAKGDTYPIAMLIVFELTGDFDVAAAVSHGDDDARLSQNFKELNASDENWRGFPSSMIEGSYDLNGARMQTYSRMVIATGAPPTNQRYLVQFTVTDFADEAEKNGADIEAIISGFTVAPKG
ncbi:LpqN/LpqT family lipoprotein [Mycolicibacterium sp. F2034L]|uniref:LpqN/LpqT family lipoprotein n=1 Tax=Mycolicibacterium sp. F2034L TaxID=2926422 RepID=UPI001FF3C552|nr:LpqN/LpqT family lipoprotein [Mycolicibacterium sp. F2034L]MCK0172861.1 LpqN/LpqT family lipoprotein [Mycolicibacterium sp. F2034L]